MIIRDIQNIIEEWAPPGIAWERDNVGLQVGNPDGRVRGILVSLDVTEEVVSEARKKRANLIVSHHPLLFHPAREITPRTAAGRCINALCRNDIAVFSAHTNLDFSPGGTNSTLATKLGLTDTSLLRPSNRVGQKIVTFVPAADVDRVARAMADAGAGTIGNYEECSFRAEGVGTFRGNAASHPTIGKAGTRERVQEVRLEMPLPRWRAGAVVAALRQHHPYEEAAYDIYPVENRSDRFGEGLIGMLPKPVTAKNFLTIVKRALKSSAVRTSFGKQTPIRRVAVSAGGGSSLLGEAMRAGADAMVTADVSYHTFQDAGARILLVDAGHFETERPVVDALTSRLKLELQRRGERIPVTVASGINPVRYY